MMRQRAVSDAYRHPELVITSLDEDLNELPCLEETEKESIKKVHRGSTYKRDQHHRRWNSLPIGPWDQWLDLVDKGKSCNQDTAKIPCSETTEQEDSKVHKREPERDLVEFIDKQQWLEIEICCEENPESARLGIKLKTFGEITHCLPIHGVCKERAPVEAVDAIITAFPDGVRMTDSLHNRLPIHYACLYGASVGVVKDLVTAYPIGVQHADKEGNLPLHYAASYCSPAVFQIILDAFPQAAQTANLKNRLPLHLACIRMNPEDEIIQSLIACFIQALREKDSQGSLPVHIACQTLAPLHVIQLLLHYHPKSIFSRDTKGRTPLDIAKSIRHPALSVLTHIHCHSGNPALRYTQMFISHRKHLAYAFKKARRGDTKLMDLKYITRYPKNAQLYSCDLQHVPL